MSLLNGDLRQSGAISASEKNANVRFWLVDLLRNGLEWGENERKGCFWGDGVSGMENWKSNQTGIVRWNLFPRFYFDPEEYFFEKFRLGKKCKILLN